MFAVDAASGNVLWRLPLAGLVKSGVVAKDGVLYFGDGKGYLWAVDARRGTVRRKTKMIDTINIGSPIIVGATLIIGTAKGYVLAMPLSMLQ